MRSILKMENAANSFLDTLDNVISEKLKRVDDTILCKIRQINEDGTVNVTVEPDESNVITGVGNILLSELNTGDYVWVYRIGKSFVNSFIIYKLGYNVNPNDFKNTNQVITYVSSSSQGGETSNIVITSGDDNGQIKVINGNYSYNVSIKGLQANAYTSTPIPTVYIEDAIYDGEYLTLQHHNGAETRIPISGGEFVTLDTDQEITGIKTFTQTIHSTNDTPFVFESTGSGTYNKGAFVCNESDGIGLEAPFVEDNMASDKLPITFGWRGGANNTGGLKIDSSGAYEKISSNGAWRKVNICDTYNFTNNFSDTWEITHNMNKFPQVAIIRVYIDGSTGQIVKTEEIIAEVDYVNSNKLIIKFEEEIKGYAYLC